MNEREREEIGQRSYILAVSILNIFEATETNPNIIMSSLCNALLIAGKEANLEPDEVKTLFEGVFKVYMNDMKIDN